VCRLLVVGDLCQSPASCVCSATSRRRSTTPRRRPKNARASCPPISSMTRRLAKRIGPASLLRDTRPFSSARQIAAASSAPSRASAPGKRCCGLPRRSIAAPTFCCQASGPKRTCSRSKKPPHSSRPPMPSSRLFHPRHSSGWPKSSSLRFTSSSPMSSRASRRRG